MRIFLSFSYLCVLYCTSAFAADDGLAALQNRIARLESGIREVEAIRAVKRLQYAYSHYAELGQWNDLADLFANKGVGHYPAGNLGREAIRKLFIQDVGKGIVGLRDGMFYPHIMLQPVVNLAPDGKSAKGRWRVFAMLGSYGGMAVWAGGIYENEYIFENGVWKINDLHYYSQFTGRYDQDGWTADKGAIPIHYDPASAGSPIPKRAILPTGTKTSPSLQSMSRRLADLARRAQLLSDEDAVTNLQLIYGYYVDRKMWNDVADLFAPDATMELGLQGVYVGKASIRRALNQFGSQGLREGEINDHLQLNTVVHVAPDGLTARDRGVELGMTGMNGVGGQWSEGIFENEFVKRNGKWQFKSLHFYPRMITDYDKGWAKDAKPAPGPNREFPPDRPPAERYEIYPKFYLIPFHFSNPVRSPEKPRPMAGVSPSIHTVKELVEKTAEAERLLRAAIAHDSSENIASAYGYYLDEFMWDETADLFTRDARRDLSFIGVETGRETIRQSLKRRYPGKKSADYVLLHQLIQPVIHVAPDGQSANMRVRLFQLAGPSGGSGSWIAGIYECRTGVEDGVWKFKEMDLDYTWTADYKSGWARVDDRKKGIVAAPFPKIVDLPFHYANPVTGRNPPVPLPQR
jgi:hypothetical protein